MTGRGGSSCDATFRGRVVPGQSLENIPRCQYRGHLFKPIAMPIPRRLSTMPNSVGNSLHDANSVNLFLSRCQFRESIFIVMPHSAKERARCQFRERFYYFRAKVSCDATFREHSGPD